MSQPNRPPLTAADTTAESVRTLITEIYSAWNSPPDVINAEMAADRRRARLKTLLVYAGVGSVIAAILGLPSLLREQVEPTDLASLPAGQQAAARGLALSSMNVLEFTGTCAVELGAKASILDNQRSLGLPRPEEPDAADYREAAKRAEAAGIPCATGIKSDNYSLIMDLSGTKVIITFDGNSLVDDNNVPRICPSLGTIEARAAAAETGSDLSIALGDLAAVASSYCRPVASTPTA